MKRKYRIRTTSIDYCVSCEDIDSDDYDEKKIIKEINRIKKSLPQKIIIQIKCEPDDLEDEIIDAISDRTGWLVNSVQYEIDPL